MIEYDAAKKWLEGRVNLLNDRPTNDRPVFEGGGLVERGMSTTLPAHLRANAFWTARQGEAGLVSRIREVSDQVSSGKMTVDAAKNALIPFMVAGGKTTGDHAAPPPPGVDPVKWREASRMTNIASAMRVDLILKQQASMAYGVQRWEETMNPISLKRRPYLMYVHGATRKSKKPRPDHQALNGMVFPKDDPVWHSIFPPNGFGCSCGVKELRAAEAEKIGIADSSKIKPPSGDGFEFDPGAAYEAVKMNPAPPDQRAALREQCEAFVRKDPDCPRMTIYSDPVKDVPPKPIPPPDEAGIRKYFKEVEKGLDAAKAENGGALPDKFPREKMPAETLSLGKLPEEYRDAFGIEADKADVTIGIGSKHTKKGLRHWFENHKNEMNEAEAMRILNETLYRSGNRTAYAMARKKDGSLSKLLVIDNPEKNLFLVMAEGDNGYEFVSASRTDEEYRSRNWVLKQIIEDIEEA